MVRDIIEGEQPNSIKPTSDLTIDIYRFLRTTCLVI